jgi:hypothetical protein
MRAEGFSGYQDLKLVDIPKPAVSDACPKTSPGKSHLRREIRDRNTCGAHVVDMVRNQAKVFLPYGNPLTVGSVLKSAIGAEEHHA